MTKENTCEEIHCEDGKFLDKNECRDCDRDCKTCEEDSRKCTSCEDKY